MKSTKKTISSFFSFILLAALSILCINMTGGTQKEGPIEPSFIPLEEDQGNFTGMIYDDKNEIKVKDISFTGHTAIGGIRKEDDDSVNKLDLAKITELNIVKPVYVSKKYSDKEFILANAISSNGTLIKNLLIPRQVVICGVDSENQMEKAWFLYKISKITINKNIQKKDTTEIKEEESIFNKIKGGIKSLVE